MTMTMSQIYEHLAREHRVLQPPLGALPMEELQTNHKMLHDGHGLFTVVAHSHDDDPHGAAIRPVCMCGWRCEPMGDAPVFCKVHGK